MSSIVSTLAFLLCGALAVPTAPSPSPAPVAVPAPIVAPNTDASRPVDLSLDAATVPGSAAWSAQAHALRFAQDEPSNLTLAELYITGILYGSMTGTGVLYGMADLSAKIAAPLQILPIAGGIIGAYMLSHQKPRLHGGVLSAVNYGILAGYVDGLFLSFALTPRDAGGDTIARAGVATAWVVATAGGAASGYLAHKWGATTGDMAIMYTTTFWGAVTGLMLPSVLGADPSLRLTSTSILLGSLAGSGIGVTLAAYHDFSRARSWFLDLGAIAGLAVGSSILGGADVDNNRARAGILLAGEAAGLAVAGLLTHALDVPELELPLAMRVGPSPIAWTNAANGATAFVPGLAMTGAF